MAHTEAPALCFIPVGDGSVALVDGNDCEFARGYVDAGGRIEYLRHLIADVRPCEGEWGVVYPYPYVSAFQFDVGSWATASAATKVADPLDPYHVGVNVAWWILHIADPGSTEGWPTCWHRRGAP